MGVGGGFIMVPALIYLLQSADQRRHRHLAVPDHLRLRLHDAWCRPTTNQTVDIVLAFVLMVGGVAGAQYGARAGQKLRGEQLRALLALLVLAVALRLALSICSSPRPTSIR